MKVAENPTRHSLVSFIVELDGIGKRLLGICASGVGQATFHLHLRSQQQQLARQFNVCGLEVKRPRREPLRLYKRSDIEGAAHSIAEQPHSLLADVFRDPGH